LAYTPLPPHTKVTRSDMISTHSSILSLTLSPSFLSNATSVCTRMHYYKALYKPCFRQCFIEKKKRYITFTSAIYNSAFKALSKTKKKTLCMTIFGVVVEKRKILWWSSSINFFGEVTLHPIIMRHVFKWFHVMLMVYSLLNMFHHRLVLLDFILTIRLSTSLMLLYCLSHYIYFFLLLFLTTNLFQFFMLKHAPINSNLCSTTNLLLV